jgi:uncharacterized protein (DUF169 family)
MGEKRVTTIKEFNKYGEELERLLGLRTSPVAVKMLEKEEDIPADALRPKKDQGHHYAQCQAFSLSRRDRITVAMLKEDNWCPGPVIAFGMERRPTDPAARAANQFDCFDYGKYIGVLTAPVFKASFKPDVVIIYCDTNQLRIILLSLKMEDRPLVKTNLFPFSCSNAIIPVMQNGEYWVNLPDPGEYARALTIAGEMMFSIPGDKFAELTEGLREFDKNESGFAHEQMMMRPDFPQPDLYKHVFESWDMDHE